MPLAVVQAIECASENISSATVSGALIVSANLKLTIAATSSVSYSLKIRRSVGPLTHRNQVDSEVLPGVVERENGRTGQTGSPCCRLGL